MNQEVLVLNADYEPLNVCNLRRAIVLVYLGKADVLHAEGEMETVYQDGRYVIPSVVKLRNHIKRPLPELKLSRRTIFARDNYTCQYCGSTTKDLTIDHVIPRVHGGKSAWENLVCCCRKCNMKKSDKLAHQVGMKLIRTPRRPRYVPYISLTKYLMGRKNEIWRNYLPVFADLPD
ncbi:MAG TPA: HNH endonuclease [Chthonomonadaceae bacterium]|nr:HNH endonuclease [Chthonomonadaceae bacterium]